MIDVRDVNVLVDWIYGHKDWIFAATQVGRFAGWCRSQIKHPARMESPPEPKKKEKHRTKEKKRGRKRSRK